ncbi:hypothetical protein UlMin_042564 [Ulmus minor]
MAGLRNSIVLKYLVSVGKPDTVSYPELINEICRHIDAEKASNLDASKLSQNILLGGGKRKMDSQVSRQDDDNNGKKNKNGGQNGGNNNNRGGPPPAQIPRFCKYTPLTDTVATVFNQAEHRGIFNYPLGIRTPANKRDNTKYCRFYRDTGHTTEECRVLKDEVERLIQRGQLREYVRGANQQPREARGLWHPHTDAIVVTLRITGQKVFRILVDNGSSADILFKSTFNKMNLVGVKIEPTTSSLSGFTGDSISSEGILNLPVELGSSPCQHIQAVDFVLVDCPSPYNAIIGRPTLNKIRAVTSTYHLLVKFPTVGGIGILRGDQTESREIYEAANRLA